MRLRRLIAIFNGQTDRSNAASSKVRPRKLFLCICAQTEPQNDNKLTETLSLPLNTNRNRNLNLAHCLIPLAMRKR